MGKYTVDQFTLPELQVLIAAYAYEVLDRPVLSDYIFDRICEVTSIGTKIPEFVTYSGMWIKDIEVSGLEQLCLEVCDSLDHDKIAHSPLIKKACDKLGIRVQDREVIK